MFIFNISHFECSKDFPFELYSSILAVKIHFHHAQSLMVELECNMSSYEQYFKIVVVEIKTGLRWGIFHSCVWCAPSREYSCQIQFISRRRQTIYHIGQILFPIHIFHSRAEAFVVEGCHIMDVCGKAENLAFQIEKNTDWKRTPPILSPSRMAALVNRFLQLPTFGWRMFQSSA